MFKLLLAFALVLSSLSSFATVNRAVKITSKVVDGNSVTRVFNGSLFTTICRGEISVLTANDEVVVKEVKKLVVRGDKVEQIIISLDDEIVDSQARLVCEL